MHPPDHRRLTAAQARRQAIGRGPGRRDQAHRASPRQRTTTDRRRRRPYARLRPPQRRRERPSPSAEARHARRSEVVQRQLWRPLERVRDRGRVQRRDRRLVGAQRPGQRVPTTALDQRRRADDKPRLRPTQQLIAAARDQIRASRHVVMDRRLLRPGAPPSDPDPRSAISGAPRAFASPASDANATWWTKPSCRKLLKCTHSSAEAGAVMPGAWPSSAAS